MATAYLIFVIYGTGLKYNIPMPDWSTCKREELKLRTEKEFKDRVYFSACIDTKP